MDIHDIYTALIMEKSSDQTHHRELDNADHSHRAFNASCGDDITLHLKVDQGLIADASFTGIGCAISQASSTMMIELILGKTPKEAIALANKFMGMIKKEIQDEEELAELEDAIYLQNISNMPARVKCAVLSWHGLTQALEDYAN